MPKENQYKNCEIRSPCVPHTEQGTPPHIPESPSENTSHGSHKMQYLESWLHRFLQESSVQIYPGEIQHHLTSRILLLSPPGLLLDCCVRWARCVRRFDDQPGFGACLDLDGPGSLDVPPGLAGLHGVDVRFGFLDSHQHDEPRGFGIPSSLPGLHRAPEVRNCCRWPCGYNTWLWIRDIELIGQTRSVGRGLR